MALDHVVPEARQFLLDVEQQLQDSVVQCMTAAGFDYVLVDPLLALTQRNALRTYVAELGSPEWFRHYGMGVTTQVAAESDLGPGLIGVTYVQPPPDLTDPNTELRDSLDEVEASAWDEALARCRHEARQALAASHESAESTPAEIAAQAEENMEALLETDPEVFEARNRFFGCLADAGFQVPHGGAQRVLSEFVEDEYLPLLEKFWFGEAPWPEDDLEALRVAQEWEQGLGAAVAGCDMHQLLHVVRPAADRIRAEQIAELSNS